MPSRRLITKLVLLDLLSVMPLQAIGPAERTDHPLFPNRMPGYTISTHKVEQFSSYKFSSSPPTVVEGKYTRISYYLGTGNQHPGALAILRNYENAIRAVGGEVLLANDKLRVMRSRRGGQEVWAELEAGKGRYYFLHIVEKGALEQVVTADAMAAALDREGFVALDIHFATGKAEILRESIPILEEIAALMKQRPELNVGIEGHTDSTGTPEGNRKLSEARARSVAAAVAARGVHGSRMTAAGFGQDRPVADNGTEAGRAKNRRVEIVKR